MQRHPRGAIRSLPDDVRTHLPSASIRGQLAPMLIDLCLLQEEFVGLLPEEDEQVNSVEMQCICLEAMYMCPILYKNSTHTALHSVVQIAGTYQDAMSGNTKLGKAVRAAVEELETLNNLVRPLQPMRRLSGIHSTQNESQTVL